MPLADVCDSVELTDTTGQVRTLQLSEYEKLPLKERVSALIAKRLKFMMHGKEISAHDVVAAMNK